MYIFIYLYVQIHASIISLKRADDETADHLRGELAGPYLEVWLLATRPRGRASWGIEQTT